MKIKTMLLALILAFAPAVAMAQTPSGSPAGQSATAPDPQAVPDNSANAGNSSANPMATPRNNAELQSRIEDAIRNEPTLGNSHVSVNVDDDAIDLSGTVGSTKDKQTAERIAESFDGNRKLNDKLVVTGHGHSDMAPDHSSMNNGGTGNAPNPAMNSGSGTPPKN
jgi:osmotically-inducible protein OsmY